MSKTERRKGRRSWWAGAALGLSCLAPSLDAAERPIPVIDLHVDINYRSLYAGSSFADGSGQFRAGMLVDGGVAGVVLPLYVPEKAGRTREQLERSYAHVFSSILQTPPYALPGCSTGRAGSSKRSVATWLAFEGAGAIGADEHELRTWVLRGVRSFGLVHTRDNRLATSAGTGPWLPANDRGLTDEGRRFVELVHRVGGVVDLSHASDRSVTQAIAIAVRDRRPIMATHSNARGLAPHARNLTDEHIRGIARTGGIVGVNFHQPYLRKKGASSASLGDVVEQILYIRRVGGAEAVAIGSDFEGGIVAVPELADASRFGRLSQALRESGLSKRDVEDVFFRNAWRVLCGPGSGAPG